MVLAPSGGLLIDDLRDAQQRAAVGPGGNRIAEEPEAITCPVAAAEAEGQAFPVSFSYMN